MTDHSARAREIYAKWCDVDDFKLDADLIPLITAALRDVERETLERAAQIAEGGIFEVGKPEKTIELTGNEIAHFIRALITEGEKV
jgi:hypothetical protein